MRKLIIILLGITISLNLISQRGSGYSQGERPTGKIIGTIIDDKTNEAVMYATVAAFSFKDSTLVTGIMTGEGGKFEIPDVPAGRYYLEIKFIGYEKLVISDIKVRPPELLANIGVQKLKQSSVNLEGVEIIAEKTYVEYKIDKKVVNVGQDLNSSGGTAVDALENVPSVTVDIDGNVALRGSTSFTVFINGKPTPLSGTDALQQIPIGAVKNIEIITNPSAKYDPDGLSGIINVVLKENVKLGLNGLIDITVSNRGTYGANGVFSYNVGKFNLFVGGNYNDGRNPGEGQSELTTYLTDTTLYRITELDRNRGRKNYNAKAGFDFMPNNKNTLSFETSVGAHSRIKDFTSRIHEYNSPQSYNQYTLSLNPGDSDYDFYSLSGNYEFKIDSLGSNLQMNAYFESESGLNEDLSEEYFADQFWNPNDSIIHGIITREYESGSLFRFRADLVKNFKNKTKIEAGTQLRLYPRFHEYEYEEYQSDKGWVSLPEYGSQLNFAQNIYSVYGLYAGQYKTFGYQVGLRGEQTYRNVFDDTRDYHFKINRFDVFPTLHFSKKFKFNQQMLLSYSRRIDRPGGWELEPFTRYISSNFKRQGNPELQPEFTDNFELSYQKSIDESSFSIEGYYRKTNNKISRIQSIDSTSTILMTFENLDNDISTGIEMMLNLRLIKWMDINISSNYYYYQLISENSSLGSVNSTSNNFDIRGNINFILSKTTRLQFNAFYGSPSVTAQGKSSSNFMASASMRQDFFKRTLSVSLRVNDIFNTMRHEFTTTGPNFTNFNSFSPMSPTITLNVSYRINNYKEKRNGNGMENGEGGDGIM